MTKRSSVIGSALAVLLSTVFIATLPAAPQDAAGSSRSPRETGLAAPVGEEWRRQGLATFDAVWRTVHETYFDPAFGGLDWQAVRDQLRPKVLAARSPDEQRAVVREMLRRLGQSHFALLSRTDDGALRGPALPPIEVRVADGQLFVVRVTSRALDVRPGDRIVAIDDRPVDELFARIDPDDPRRAEMAWRAAMRELSGLSGSMVHLDLVAPDGTERRTPAVRVVPPGEMVTVGNLPSIRAHLAREERRTGDGRRIGIIRFNVWMTAIAEPFAQAIDAFRDADGLVIDLRGNPGGLAEMIRGIAGHLIDEAVPIGYLRMRDLELEFIVNPRRSTSDGRAVRPYAGPVAVLVDELTASASECFAAGLQALGRARVFGRRTAGQALPASTQQLLNGDVLLYAVGDFSTPDGRRLEGRGVEPDVEVSLDPAQLAAGRDAETAAIEWLLSLQ